MVSTGQDGDSTHWHVTGPLAVDEPSGFIPSIIDLRLVRAVPCSATILAHVLSSMRVCPWDLSLSPPTTVPDPPNKCTSCTAAIPTMPPNEKQCAIDALEIEKRIPKPRA
eukprot:492906-Rhodomonas_salina.2